MEFIDLQADGRAVWNEFLSVDQSQLPRLTTFGIPDDEFTSVFVQTEFHTGFLSLDAPDPQRPGRLASYTAPLLIDPTHGIWVVEVSGSTDAYPPLESWRFEAVSHAQMRIAEAFGWDPMPVAALLVFPYLERSNCIPDFAAAPFDVYFRDDLIVLPEILREEPMARNHAEVVGALGALANVAHVIPPFDESMSCSPELYESLVRQPTLMRAA